MKAGRWQAKSALNELCAQVPADAEQWHMLGVIHANPRENAAVAVCQRQAMAVLRKQAPEFEPLR